MYLAKLWTFFGIKNYIWPFLFINKMAKLRASNIAIWSHCRWSINKNKKTVPNLLQKKRTVTGLFNRGQSRPLFVYFRSFLIPSSIIQIEKDGVLGIRTWDSRIVGADETTELPMTGAVLSGLFRQKYNFKRKFWNGNYLVYSTGMFELMTSCQPITTRPNTVAYLYKCFNRIYII